MVINAPHGFEVHSLCNALGWVEEGRGETHEITRKQRQREENDSCEGEAAPDDPIQLEPRSINQRCTHMTTFISYDLICHSRQPRRGNGDKGNDAR